MDPASSCDLQSLARTGLWNRYAAGRGGQRDHAPVRAVCESPLTLDIKASCFLAITIHGNAGISYQMEAFNALGPQAQWQPVGLMRLEENQGIWKAQRLPLGQNRFF